MSQIMSHLVGNYPNPEIFQEALQTILQKNIAYLEIQFPFTHPVGDGPVIYQANQVALEHHLNLQSLIEHTHKTKSELGSKTELILMGYLTPFLDFGLENLTNLLLKNNFKGAIIPDLAFGSEEQIQLSTLFKDKLDLIPVLSPLTSQIRLEKIKKHLQKGQLVYATARSGQTGSSSNLEDETIKTYFTLLKNQLNDYKIAIGFGIKDRHQVQLLNSMEFIAVIGSQIIREINSAVEKNSSVQNQLLGFFDGLE
jgi:tryptophan synthase alpha chain